MASPSQDDTLGEKHRNHNKLVNDAIKKTLTQEITAINVDESDTNNLYKIDIACYNRNVEFILAALQCEDILYVSRVIKQSTWLVTDQQYSDIINPEYLHENLHPKMTSKAFNKLILHIRLNLKDEKRVESFFKYYEKDLQKAFKWLPRCSIPFIENIIREHGLDIPKKIMIRLHRRSITFLEILVRKSEDYYKGEYFMDAKFLLMSNSDKFLDIMDGDDFSNYGIKFGPKLTRIVMETNPERIMNNLGKYIHYLELSTFAKFVKKEELHNFILTLLKNKEARVCLNHNNIKHFLNRLPIKERFDFVQKYFIEKSYEDERNLIEETWDDIVSCCNPPVKGNMSSKNIYSWYVYAPFTRAFEDLKQLIRNESNPAERIGILRVMLTCAGSDRKNILTLLKYYRENHINEPFMFKKQFVNSILINTDTHNYDEEAWGYLNDLFNSMEVYTESEKSVQSCVKAIILRNVINGEKIPEIIGNKFEFENLNSKNKFNSQERKKVFDFLYNHLISKINNEFKTEKDFDETVDIIVKVLNLLKEWNKELQDFPLIVQKIKDLITVRKENSWKKDLSSIYNVKKSWRKHLLAESILLSSTEDSCINALKHDPKLLEIYKEEITTLCIKDKMILKRFLKKIRIDWYQSLAESFKSTFLENVYKKHSHVALIKGLCMLFSQKEILNFINKHAPTEAKIDWSQPSELELNVCKYIAKSMHLARPQPPLATALLYAKGDYMQFALPSLDAILYNIKSTVFCEHLAELLNTPISLQKHGIRAAFAKLKYDKLKCIFSKIWDSTKNSTIRSEIFYHTYKRLCNENDETVISKIWELLSMFIEKLTFEENKKIYVTLTKADKVPLSVRAEFWTKSYDFLKKLPAKENSSSLIYDLDIQSESDGIIEFLDVDFMAKIYFEEFDNKFAKQPYKYCSQIAKYLLSTKTETAQKERYEKILVPLLENAFTLWDKQYENVFYARYNIMSIFNEMSSKFQDDVLNKEMLFPIALYTGALNKLQNILSIRENYLLLTQLKLSLAYIKTIHDLKRNKELAVDSDLKESIDLKKGDKWKHLHYDAAPIFGRICLDYLMEDVATYFPSITVMFASVLSTTFSFYFSHSINTLRVLKVFLDKKDFIQGQLLVMKLIPQYLSEDDEEALRREMVNELSSHPSEEVVMHYWYFRKNEL